MTAPRIMEPQPLTQEAFAPFGDVIEAGAADDRFGINKGYTERFHNIAEIDTGAEGGRTIISLFRSKPLPTPINLRMMERHPLGCQAFIPLSGRPFLVAVAPPGEFDPDAITLFKARSDQGVNYRAGVWHHFCLALEAESDFLVIDRAGPGDNLDEVALTGSDVIEVSGL